MTDLMMQQLFLQQPQVADQVSHYEQLVVEGKMPPLKAAEEIVNFLRDHFNIK